MTEKSGFHVYIWYRIYFYCFSYFFCWQQFIKIDFVLLFLFASTFCLLFDKMLLICYIIRNQIIMQLNKHMNTFPFYRHVIELYAFLLESHLMRVTGKNNFKFHFIFQIYIHIIFIIWITFIVWKCLMSRYLKYYFIKWYECERQVFYIWWQIV